MSLRGWEHFKIRIIDIGSGIECTLGKFPEDTKLSGASIEGRDAIQRDAIQRNADRLQK